MSPDLEAETDIDTETETKTKEEKEIEEMEFAVYNTAVGDETSPLWREVLYKIIK